MCVRHKKMHVSSIKFFAASCWLVLCVISPLHSTAERMSSILYGVNNPARHQFQRIQPEDTTFSFEERGEFESNARVPKPRDINQINSLQFRTSPRNINSEVHVKQNVAKLRPEYRVENRKSKPYYSEYLKKENAARSAELEQETRRRDKEIVKKMNVLDKLLSESSEENDVESKITAEDRIIAEMIPEETRRVVRQVRRQRPGFFWTLARLAFETFNDTRSAIQQISNIVSQTVEPEMPSARSRVSSNPLMVVNTTTTIAPGSDQNNMSSNMASVNVTTTTMRTTTTMEPFRLTRNGLLQLLSRNIRGLIRLFNIEWQDALNQSEINVREFQKNLGNQIGSYLQDNPNAF
ncbi:uncharacterized protein LOC109853985 isoform X2 [Pseudomyrmex gracilis]|uniref:uncharacterized protein LOC109853985 isoform X2 n=1 Tax=Pseudomyrmex gracilis TaxID=219809 RepID=UPI00099567FC|nr:uncharacterized protein LOC109853985 isoform X2 [Pseudomyrmex gracilis]